MTAAGAGDAANAAPELVAVLAGKDGHTTTIGHIAVSPDGRLIASCAFDGTMKLWDMAAARPAPVALPKASRCPSFSSDGRSLVTLGVEDTVALWDVKTRAVQWTDSSDNVPLATAYSSDGRWVAVSCQRGTIRLYEAATGTLTRELKAQGRDAYGVAFSPDAQMLASTETDGCVRLWVVPTGKLVGKLIVGPVGHEVRGVAFSPDGKSLVTTSNGGLVKLWNPDTKEKVRVLQEDVLNAYSMLPAWRADGGLVAWSQPGNPGAVLLSDPNVELRTTTLRAFPPNVTIHGFTFAPDGRHVLIGGSTGEIYVLRLAPRGKVFELPPKD